MKINKNYIEQIQKRKGANSKTAHIVFSYLDKYRVDYKTDWGKKLAGAMLRKQKKYNLVPMMADVDEKLDWMSNNAPNVYKDIMSSNESKTRYFWSKFIK